MNKKAILFRTAEKLFSALELEGYRANAVAYAIAWLAESSQRRINLPRIWDEQRVPPATQEAIKSVCRAAHAHLTQTSGNVGEWSKRPECWDNFRQQDVEIQSDWTSEWAETSFSAPPSDLDGVAQEWERVRVYFSDDARTLGELEALTGKEWIARRRGDEVRSFASKSWMELREMRASGPGGRRLRNIRELVELLSSAAQMSATIYAQEPVNSASE